jgi:large conductance mechanosensitive channel
MSVIKEFKEFISRGNVVDLAVGVIIGAAFGKIVSSLVADVVMPPLGVAIGGINFSDLHWELRPEVDLKHPAVVVKYGLFLQSILDFLLVALAIFALVKVVNRLHRKPPAAPPPPPREIELLTEIRDALIRRQP